jgi:aminoglycoside phosphotransferase (APT) family kinase protein
MPLTGWRWCPASPATLALARPASVPGGPPAGAGGGARAGGRAAAPPPGRAPPPPGGARARAAPPPPPAGPGARLERWFTEHVADVDPPLAYERIAGGRSNLTFRVADAAGRQFVLRRPPLHSRLPSAHDMAREHRIQTALADTAVPVPRMIGYCADEAVTGAEFYVMEHVDGLVVRDRSAAEPLSAAARRAASDNLVDTLVALHAVEPDDVGLGDLARKDGYIARQLKRWQRQWEAQKTRDLMAMDEAHAALAAQIPEQGPARVVHGDYRLDNLLLAPDGEVRAVLDWELCTLGDPLADVGTVLVYWAEAGDRVVPLGDAATLEPGFAGRAQLVERYRARAGTAVDLDFYMAFAYWRLAAILEGVYARTLAGAYGDVDESVMQYGLVVEALAEEARRLVA